MAIDTAAIRRAQARLVQRLQLPDTTTDVVINLKADQLAKITITRLLTPAEIDEISTWYVVEKLDRVPSGETTYSLEARPPVVPPSTPVQCDPVEQQARQDQLDALYQADGRHDPAHPAHATYTGLVAAQR